MTASIAEQIFDAVEARLATVPGVAVVARHPSGPHSRFPAIELYDDGEGVVAQDWQITRAVLELSVTIIAKGQGAANAHREALALDCGVIRALFADQQLGGLCAIMRLGDRTTDPAEGALEAAVSLTRRISIDFSYQTTDPAALAA